MKSVYMGVATLLLTVAIVACCAVGVREAATGAFNEQIRSLACITGGVLCFVLLVYLFQQIFVHARFSTALQEWARGCLAFVLNHYNTILVVLVLALIGGTFSLGVGTLVVRCRDQLRIAQSAQQTINSLQENLSVAQAKLDRLEAEVAALLKENEQLRNTVKTAARAGVKVPSRGLPSRGSLGRDADRCFGWRQGTYVGQWVCTAYNPVAWQCDSTPEITATGNRVQPGYTAAIDPRYWRFGTRFYVAGLGEVIADDTGAKVKGRERIDICVQDIAFAKQLGKWVADVWVLDEPGG